jgi:serine/threonine protein kinase
MAVDMWSLGCVVYNIASKPKRVPFLNLSETLKFCRGVTTIPKEPLHPILNDVAINFINRLLGPQPNQRVSAEAALQDPWILSPVVNGSDTNLSAITSSPGASHDITPSTITPIIKSPNSRDNWYESELVPITPISKSPNNQTPLSDGVISPFSFQEFDTVNTSLTAHKFSPNNDDSPALTTNLKSGSFFGMPIQLMSRLSRKSLDSKPPPTESKPPIYPSIYFKPYRDPRDHRPSLEFKPLVRLVEHGEVISVGRYREGVHVAQWKVQPHTPSNMPVGFKSKVVSRVHCEFWFDELRSLWYIRDVKSSSGTFLTSPPYARYRLSAAGEESPPSVVRDGDIVQLGVDFRGGEEMIYRCVKIKIECHEGLDENLHWLNMVANNIDPGADPG